MEELPEKRSQSAHPFSVRWTCVGQPESNINEIPISNIALDHEKETTIRLRGGECIRKSEREA